eukprot:2934251-Lingulodinium_polyedra.AAC.1
MPALARHSPGRPGLQHTSWWTDMAPEMCVVLRQRSQHILAHRTLYDLRNAQLSRHKPTVRHAP